MTFPSGVIQSSITSVRPDLCLGHRMSTLTANRTVSRIARGKVRAGYGVFRVPGFGAAGGMLDPGEVFQIPDPGVAADVDAIVASITSSTGIQTFSGSALNGVVGSLKMQPARRLTLTLSNHADWNSTNATVVGYNHLGQPVTELMAIPDGGNATVTTSAYFLSVTSLSIPAQAGTGGTATFGVAALTAGLTIADYLGVAERMSVKQTVNAGGLYGYPGETSNLVTADYVDGESVNVVKAAEIVVYSEVALIEGQALYVRAAAGAGGSVLGAFRNDADTSSCVLVPGAEVVRSTTGAGPAWVYLPHYVGA